jgi:hypothetical protein
LYTSISGAQAARIENPEDHSLNPHCCENFKSCNKKCWFQKFNDVIDPMDPDAEFNRLRESVTEKKETRTRNKKVSSCICSSVKVAFLAVVYKCHYCCQWFIWHVEKHHGM